MSRTLHTLMATLLLLAAGTAGAARLTDQTGRSVNLPGQVKRVVAIPIPVASMVMAVDEGSHRLAGINPAARDDLDNALLGKMFPEAKKISSAVAGENFAPNPEALAASGADMVFQWGDRGEAIVKPIAELGLPVITLRYGDSSLAAGWLRLVGAALDKPARGEALARWVEQGIADVGHQGVAVPAAQRPNVLYLMRARSTFQVAGRGTSMDGDMRLAGGHNVARDIPGFAPVGVEQILAWNPDVILLNNFEPGLGPAEILRDSRLAGLAAVRQGRVYGFPRGGFRWDPPSQETPLALHWLFNVLHPQRALPGLRSKIASAYRMLYRYPVTPAEIDQVLRLDANGGGAHYRSLFADPTR